MTVTNIGRQVLADVAKVIVWSFVPPTPVTGTITVISLQWRHNERNGASNRRRIDCLLNRLFRRRSKKISKLSVTGLRVGGGGGGGEFTGDRWIPRTKGQ